MPRDSRLTISASAWRPWTWSTQANCCRHCAEKRPFDASRRPRLARISLETAADSLGTALLRRTLEKAGKTVREGESLSVLIPSAAAGDAKAERRYRELYDAASSAAEDAVTQENIPLGARFLIRRYFQAIRPKQ